MNYQIKESGWILDGEDRHYEILKVKELENNDKPRERLLRVGVSELSSQELLALILGVGTRKEEVLNMASRIFREYGEKSIAFEKDPNVISKSLTIPLIKACQIVATFELGRRFFEKRKGRQTIIRTARQAFNFLSEMSKLDKEQFRGLYLNSRYCLIHEEVISTGTSTESLVHPREVFKPAFEYNASAIIIAHNHPSGILEPTFSDINITNKLIKAGDQLGIFILDHLIIAKNKFLSVPADYTKN